MTDATTWEASFIETLGIYHLVLLVNGILRNRKAGNNLGTCD